MALGGAKVILATVTSGKAMTPLIDGLGIVGIPGLGPVVAAG